MEDILQMLLSIVKASLWGTFGMLSFICITYLVYRLSRVIGKPLIRRFFELAPEDDEGPGVIISFILAILAVIMWGVEAYLEERRTGQDLNSWDSEQMLTTIAKACLESIMILSMLSGIVMILPDGTQPTNGSSKSFNVIRTRPASGKH